MFSSDYLKGVIKMYDEIIIEVLLNLMIIKEIAIAIASSVIAAVLIRLIKK